MHTHTQLQITGSNWTSRDESWTSLTLIYAQTPSSFILLSFPPPPSSLPLSSSIPVLLFLLHQQGQVIRTTHILLAPKNKGQLVRECKSHTLFKVENVPISTRFAFKFYFWGYPGSEQYKNTAFLSLPWKSRNESRLVPACPQAPKNFLVRGSAVWN